MSVTIGDRRKRQGTLHIITLDPLLVDPVEVRVIPEDNNMDTNIEIQPERSLSDLMGDMFERERNPYKDIIAKCGRKKHQSTLIPHTSKTYESLLNTYTRTVERSCARLGVSDQDGCVFAVSITPRKSWLMQPSNKLYDDNKKLEVCEQITQLIQNECNYHLWNKPNKNTDKFIQGVNVVETKDRFGNKISQHQHGLWLLHPTVAPRFDDQFMSQFLARQTFQFMNRSYKLEDIIHSIDITPITNDVDPLTSTSGWLGYMFKNDEDQKLLGKWTAWDNGWSQST